MVKSGNVIIQIFSVNNLKKIFFCLFSNKSLKGVIYNQGVGGEQLLQILEGVETHGATKFDNSKLQILFKRHPKASEYNRAIISLLLNYAIGIAKGMVEHGVENGFDAWRRLCHHYIFLAEE